ncbi:biopolymer transporter Tol, partial [Xanthomonas sp. Kuri4-3]
LNRSVVLPVQEPRPLQAVYLSDPQRILVLGAEGDGNATLALYDRSVTPWRRLRTLADVSQVRFDREHGRVLFTRFSGDGLWRVDEALDPASVQALDTGNPSRWQYRSWALGPQGRVHYLFSSDRCPTYEGVIGPGAGDGHCLDGENFSALNGFSVDRADGTLYVPLAIEDGSGIGFMTLPKEPSSLVGVVSKWLSPLGK